jgi:outer membrane protein OmpA-like peptidoglycan-associated protein
MRMLLKSFIILPTASIGLAGAAMAQLSTEEIVKALNPNASVVGGATRGIRFGNATMDRPAVNHRPSSVIPACKPGAQNRTNSDATGASATSSPGTGPAVSLSVNFVSGSAELTPAARGSLDNLGRALATSELEKFHFRIEGHTDNVGSPDANLALSQRRADEVVRYLIGKYNVQASRLEAIGMGQEHPVVEAPPQTPEPCNRRVQVINLGA